ncbi:MAG: c-type cytochrome [Mesorhizobium sp.]|uniref:cytochrome-c peroxidase n=1 Tax=unclassified Mesorhizobium TaxID=325217 RepID=UPI000F7577B9|nr:MULTISPECIES: cytochrome-c peroxidase [unclassified Mesorhizobium]RVC77482.1 c-type cytochrome [Mesorhizobium sp. M2A.F.Ca.ET.046.02.1.1]AZO34211.1 cytochrome-c peroxidase [Mesorhizobium sp. M2A.F.Ca.ET.046.03.2.1]AZO71643.1 cytochrome-c peroxidase [Mesorhizobium sp. M1D.F.Ca.ET.043.01.1.1]RWB49779.1 MAG: c-type cytochrome [Mesorhizobium sp.]RWE22475.1 MAG: c-type cytochrome [Mesorhizobium sp.]
MKMLFTATALAFLVATAVAAQLIPVDLRQMALATFKPLPSRPAVADNPITPEKIALGKALFFDPRLSSSGVFSCNSCHNLATGGDDNRETSIGHGWQMGSRNAPTVFNAVFNKGQFWDGRAADLKAQAKGPIQAGAEMANTPDQVIDTVKSMPQYVEWFNSAFPDEVDRISFDNVAKAIEAYEATLITPAPFDAFLNGNDAAISSEQKQGLALFIEKGCSSCHSGINVGGEGYYPFGLVEKPSADVLPEYDKGRFAVTNAADDSYVFRVAPLRNVAITAPYFHSGKVWDLRQAVATMGTTQLGEDLTGYEVDRIVAFLSSLTGKLPEISYPVLPAETATTPRPQSQILRK